MARATGAASSSDLLASYFLGPKGQNASLWHELIDRVFDDYVHWRRNYFPQDESIITSGDRRGDEQLEWLDELSSRLEEVLNDLKVDYPFYSPRYVAHMTSDQTLPSVLGLFAGLLYNPNNVTREVAPVTVKLELEVGRLLADMLGFPRRPEDGPWGHLTSGGTVATLEALWIARQAQFMPLIVADVCANGALRGEVREQLDRRGRRLSAEAERALRDDDVWDAILAQELGGPLAPSRRLASRPADQLSLLKRVRRRLAAAAGCDDPALSDFLTEAVRRSPCNPASQGYAAALMHLNEVEGSALRRGVVLASEAAHYCVKKACNMLGYGGEGLRLIPVDQDFRMDVGALRQALAEVGGQEYVAAVVAIAGTTEEGAVDPIDEIGALREQTPFWLHVDAAWGGYVASVFDRAEGGGMLTSGGAPTVRRGAGLTTQDGLAWGRSGGAQDDVRAAFGAIGSGDSAVIDPHKLGYVPYPSGAVVFGHAGTRLLTAQTAPYIGAGSADADPLAARSADEPESVGAYVLEGSKPGAGATAAWLAHTSIPLTPGGHGEIVGATLLSAQKLARALTLRSERADAGRSGYDVGYRLVAEPDTNLVTFVVHPLRHRPGDSAKLEPARWSLADLNLLNRTIHARMGTPQTSQLAASRRPGAPVAPYDHPFFVSRTQMQSPQQPAGTYSFASVAPLLGDLLPSVPDRRRTYEQEPAGLIALRCVVMNPYYRLAEAKGRDFIEEFVDTLDGVATDVLKQLAEQLHGYTLIRCRSGHAAAIRTALDRSGSVRRAAVVIEPRGRESVMVEVRELADAGADPREQVRRLVNEYDAEGVERAETFVGAEVRGGLPAGERPAVYVLAQVRAGRARKVLDDAVNGRPDGVGIEGRIVTGSSDVAFALSGPDRPAVEQAIEQIAGLRSRKEYWVRSA